MMDFGPTPESKPEIKPKLESRAEVKKSTAKYRHKNKKPLLIVSAILIFGLVATGLYYFNQPKNPLPANIKSQISYKTIYPSRKADAIDTSSYNYESSNKTLTFNIQSSGTKVVFTEQPAPENLSSGGQVYYPALGIHPYAQFQSKLGPVALAKFFQAGNLKANGQSAILAAQGTLVIAHSDKDLTNSQWKDLFDGLKITK